MELQILLTFILAVLTVTLVGVGLYVILVLKEFRETLQKSNMILEDVENVTNAVSNPLSLITGALKGYKTFKNFRKEE